MTVQDKTQTVEVFDPAMCCSTGVCGTSVDPALARFAADLEWLQSQGVAVTRYNLAQQPGAFAEHTAVAGALRERGEECLPLVLVDGEQVSEAAYPSREELARLVGVALPAKADSLWGPAVKELVAIAAAVASNCESCLNAHVRTARQLGVSDDDLTRTVRMARQVKETAAQSVQQAANRVLGSKSGTAVTALPIATSSGGCC